MYSDFKPSKDSWPETGSVDVAKGNSDASSNDGGALRAGAAVVAEMMRAASTLLGSCEGECALYR
jgi:hypothetical protein